MSPSKTIWENWDEAAWRLDTELLSPQSRGVYREILGFMFLQNRSSSITGTHEEIARAGRCSAVQLQQAIDEIRKFRVADVTEREQQRDGGVTISVTITNRRMRRESNKRNSSLKRQQNRRNSRLRKTCVTKRKPERYKMRDRSVTGSVAITKSNESIDPIEPEKTRQNGQINGNGLNNLNLVKCSLPRIVAEIISNSKGWSYDNCKIQPVHFTHRQSLITVLQPFIGRITENSVHTCWQEAVTRTHKAAKDGLVDSNVAGYCVQCWREALQKECAVE